MAKLLEKLHQISAGRCDLCNKKLAIENSALLPLFDDSYAIRKSIHNSLLVCEAALLQLGEYHVRDQILMLMGKWGPFSCPAKRGRRVEGEAAAKNVKKFAAARATRGASSAFSLRDDFQIDGGTTSPGEHYEQKFKLHRSLSKDLPTPLRRYSGYDDLSSDVNLAANRNVRYHGLNNNEKILGLLESGSIGSLKASLYLDKSVELGLSELVVQKLKEAIELNAKSFNSISTYKVDEEGMVSFERAKEDEGHQARIKVDGTYMCQKCSRLSRLSAGELAVCSRCSKGPVVPFKLY